MIALESQIVIMSGESQVVENIAELSVEDGIENEKCVVAQYRTTLEQKKAFQNHLKSHPKTKIPIEWVIDIADESNGWFYGTAYDFDDTTQMLHVMVPDKLNPSFDGSVILDHRTVHLIECVDGVSDALFNKIVRDSIVKVKWDVEWFEEDPNAGENAAKGGDEAANGKWVASSARYYIRMANQLLVEDENFGQDSRGFVMLTADLNVRLQLCHKGRGQDDFNRLVSEGITQSTAEALEAVREFNRAQEAFGGETRGGSVQSANFRGDRESSGSASRRISGGDDVPSIRKLAEISHGLRDTVADVLDAREKAELESVRRAKSFKSFALDGDLDAGLELLDCMDEIIRCHEQTVIDSEKELLEDTFSTAKRLERGFAKLLKAGDTGGNATDEIEALRKMQKRMKDDLKEKEREVESLRNKLERR